MYMQIIRKYTNEEQAIFPEMMGHVINGMEETGIAISLVGCIWLWTWEAIGKDSFTPYSLCKMTTQLQK